MSKKKSATARPRKSASKREEPKHLDPGAVAQGARPTVKKAAKDAKATKATATKKEEPVFGASGRPGPVSGSPVVPPVLEPRHGGNTLGGHAGFKGPV